MRRARLFYLKEAERCGGKAKSFWSLTQGPDNELGKLAARRRREPPATAVRVCRVFAERCEGEQRAGGLIPSGVWREVFLEVSGLSLEGSFWRGSGQRSVAGNAGLFKVVGRQEAQAERLASVGTSEGSFREPESSKS